VTLRRVAIILPLVAFAFAACGGDDGSGSNGGGTQDPAAREGQS